MLIHYSNQEIKWAGNGYISNVRLGVEMTWNSLEYI